MPISRLEAHNFSFMVPLYQIMISIGLPPMYLKDLLEVRHVIYRDLHQAWNFFVILFRRYHLLRVRLIVNVGEKEVFVQELTDFLQGILVNVKVVTSIEVLGIDENSPCTLLKLLLSLCLHNLGNSLKIFAFFDQSSKDRVLIIGPSSTCLPIYLSPTLSKA